jgi:ABC-type lipoprotein release transport system permease subunit
MIHIARNIFFIIKDSGKNIVRALVSSFGILFLISFVVLYLSFRDSVKDYVENNIFGKLAINEIKIFPRKSASDSMFMTASSVNTSIKPETIERVRKLPELVKTYSVIRVDYDTRVRGELMGQGTRVHVPVFGMDREFFRDKDPGWQAFRTTEPLPVIAPRFVFELLNNFLSTMNLPVMTPETFRGFPLTLFIFTEDPAGKQIRNVTDAVVHTFTDVLNLPGVIVPTDFIVNFARKHQRDSGAFKKGYQYVMMVATVRDVKDLPAVSSRLKSMGLAVESRDDIAQKTNRVLAIIDDSSLVIIGILLILTVISIFNSYLTIVYTRAHKFSLKRVLGVSKIRIIMGFVFEAAVIGAIYGAAGYVLGNWLLESFAANVGKWVPALQYLALQKSGAGIFFLALVLSAAISSASALVPAFFASNINLFKAMKK